MILPGSYLISLILLVLGLVCWGSWANSVKMAGTKWRFELFYFDFAVGALVAAIIAALTFGSLGLDGFTVLDDLKLAGKKQDVMAFLAGCLFNLGNMLLVAAVSYGGMSVAYPVGLGMALIVSTLIGHFLHPQGSFLLLLAGCGAILGSVVFGAIAWRKYLAAKAAEAREARLDAQAAEGRAAAARSGKSKKPRKKSVRGKVLPIAAAAGILLGSFYPVVDMAKAGENGIGPYTIMLLFAVGIVFSTVVYNLFFMNLPFQGAAVELRDYFNGEGKQHLAGLAGGMTWCVGATALFAVGGAEGAAAVGPSIAAGLTQGFPLVGLLWGLFVWKEFADAESNTRLLLAATVFLLVAGVGVIAVALGLGPL